MNAIKKYRDRVKKYGRRYVWSIILRNKIYKPLDSVLLKIEKRVLKRNRLINCIVIESHNDFDSNGGAFYQYLIQNGYNAKYKIIWLIKNTAPDHLPANVRCFNIFRPSILKNYYICVAKVLTADDIITPKVRKDQRSYFLRHGAGGLKNVKGHAIIPENLDYILGMSIDYDLIETDQLMLSYPDKRFIYLGFPSHDLFFMNNSDELSKVTDKEYSKVILWMPTFRKGGGVDRVDSDAVFPLGIPLFKSQGELNCINDLLREKDILLIIKIHPMQDINDLKVHDMSNLVVLTGNDVKKKNIDNYRLMSCSDAMISDYSGAAYEYLQLDRPIAYVLDDMSDYKLGFVVENIHELIAGHEIYNVKDFISFVNAIGNSEDIYSVKRKRIRDYIYKFHDGNNCKRLAEHMGLEL